MFKKLILCLVLLSSSVYAQDSYDKLASELSSKSEGIKKMAIIPFSYADNTSSTKDGAVIAERLTMKLINMQKFEIIERSVLNKVLDELKLQNSGAIDAGSAKELGKVLGVDALITGTLIPTASGIEVNARVIKTETAQAIAASQVTVQKDWYGGDVQAMPQKTEYQQPQAQTQKQPISRVRSPNEYGFFDVMVGAGSQTVDIKWDTTKFGGLEMNALTASGGGPIGLRVGGFGKGVVGGDFEFSVSKHYTDAQKGTITFPLVASVNYPAGLIDATSIGLSGDLLFRTLTKAQFYLGIGLGLSINNIQSTVIKDYYNKLLNETAVGFMFRVPIGLRFNADNVTFFMEYRAEINATSFNRGFGNETNNLTFNGSRFVFGVGSKF
ncbi:MAG: FlgO family outer membrane protein [Elusimicrobiota bacterium]